MLLAAYLSIAALLYIAVTGIAFRFRYPELTQTQCALRFADWLYWR